MLNASGLSDPGPVRKSNQDSFAADDELRLFVVADGMGGHAAGEVASSLAVEAMVAFIRRSHEDTDVSWPYGIDPELSFDGNRLRTAIHLANRRVFRAAERYDEYTGMGTTVVAALVTDHRVFVGHAGDSRAYLLSDGAFRRLTVDDTWAATVLGDTPNDPTPQAMRHVLTNVVGVREDVSVHLTEF
ncbi:MAG: protein phosphatase 2C domain-containing protein, partial [Vicinamibacterales bacterium]